MTDVFGQVVSYSYDANSNRTQLSLNGSTNATYQYDVINRLTQVTDNANLNTTFVYDATDKLTSRTLPNGVVSTYQYDGLNRLTRLTHAKSASTLLDLQYQISEVNDITQLIDNLGTHNYSYDSLDRLTVATHPNQPNESYAYDDVGNRTASHQGSSYSYQAYNRLVSANGISFSYDTNGNQISKSDANGSWTYAWDYENRLKQASRSGVVTVDYSYDALGRRIQRTSSLSGTTRLIYDGIDVIRDLDGTNATIADYLNGRGVDNKSRQTSAGTSAYLLGDLLGTTRVLADSNGNLISSLVFESFGYRIGAPAATRFTFTGREADTEVDLTFYRARWYDAAQGRFISEDPIGFEGGINSYSYVDNNPIASTDPLGLASILVVVGPRSNGGLGTAYILLLDKNGNQINTCGCDNTYFVGSAIAKNPNRMLGNGVGDTPFGTYRFAGTDGGTPTSRISAGFGTGKIRMDGVFGEVADSKRTLIRLHGGGSPLLKRKPPQDPYAPYQDLTPTAGCVRMHNADVNSLIQAIQSLPKDDPLEFIFVGDAQYLNSMATNPTQAKTQWQPVLRVNMGLP